MTTKMTTYAEVLQDRSWKVVEVSAATTKRCPQCNTMVPVGSPAVLRDCRYTATSGVTPWIGNVQSYKRGAWKLYHRDCFVAFVATLNALTTETKWSSAQEG